MGNLQAAIEKMEIEAAFVAPRANPVGVTTRAPSVSSPTPRANPVMPTRAPMFRAKKTKVADEKGGGPGSGRHPEHNIGNIAKRTASNKQHWQEDSKRKDKLNGFHDTLTREGYKWKYSSNSHEGKGTIDHMYRDKKGNGAVIHERANGDHGWGYK